LLGKGAVLLRTSYGDRTSPVLRGAWVLDKLMGTPPSPPPPNVATTLDPGSLIDELRVTRGTQGRLSRWHGRGHQRAHHPLVSHRGRGRRPRPGHHRDRGAAERAAVVDEPDPPVHDRGM